MFKVDGLWATVFWQSTQRQNVLMMFPYGPEKKKKKTVMSIAKDDWKGEKEAVFTLVV